MFNSVLLLFIVCNLSSMSIIVRMLDRIFGICFFRTDLNELESEHKAVVYGDKRWNSAS